MKIKFTVLLFAFLMINTHELPAQSEVIQVVDHDNNSIEFFLVSKNGIVLKSNAEGIIQLKDFQLKEYKKEKFTIHFSNHLAYLLFHTHLYFERGLKNNDNHIKFNKITIKDLLADNDGIFHLRRKEIRLK